ncbi:MAG: hypothetical protein ACUVSE_07875 [Armatimonadota bacterium]
MPVTAWSQRAVSKKLIEFGWDEPDTAFMRRHIAQMETTPFDGCVFHLNYTTSEGKTANFTWECWSKRTFTEAELRPALEDLKATRFRKFKHNFLRFNTTPADIDWFDDFSAVLNNARLAARIAREGRCAGILFDIEQYNAPLFDYQRQRDASTKPWEEYAEQVRRRGREVMQAFQQGYPGLKVLLTFGYCLPWAQSQGGKRPLKECTYGLLAPFLDGMVDAARGGTRLTDGHELSYGFRDPAQFTKAYQTMKHDLLPIVADPRKYARVFSFSFGIWMDLDWRNSGWHTDDLSKNPHPPAQFEAIVREAMKVADEYVWIYSETPRWWSEEGKPIKLPREYTEALQRAKEG